MPNNNSYTDSQRASKSFNLYANPFRVKPEVSPSQVNPTQQDPLKVKNDEMLLNIKKEMEAETLRKLEEQKLQRQREYDEKLMKDIESGLNK